MVQNQKLSFVSIRKNVRLFSAMAVLLFQVEALNAATPNATQNKAAPQGGNMSVNMRAEPTTIHPIKATDLYSQQVLNYACDSLLTRDSNTFDWLPRLATEWEVSKDRKTFTFKLNKEAKFHDGTSITAEDVKFSFDAIFEPKYEAAHLQPYYEGIQKIEIIDPHTIKAYAKDTYYKNFDVIAGLTVIPRHIYSDVEKSNKMNKAITCSGPYTLDKYNTGQSIVLKRFDGWYGNKMDIWKGVYNFKTITYKFFKEESIILERIKKGDIDLHDDLYPESFVNSTKGDPWGKTVFASNPENNSPKNLAWIGWNLKRDIFQSKNTRLALTYLCNRSEMNQKFNNGLFNLATSPIYVGSPYAPADIKPTPFDPAKARELLAKDGWKDEDKNGILEKKINGKKVELKFTLRFARKDYQKYYEMYQQDLKKAGIEMELGFLEWNAFIALVDKGDFDAIAMRWGGGSVDPDPKQIWHSASARAGGSNFISYKNPAVDKLIDQARVEFDKAKRVKMLQTVYKMIAEDAPYVFLFNDKYDFYAVTSHIKKPGETFKYEVGTSFWWTANQ